MAAVRSWTDIISSLAASSSAPEFMRPAQAQLECQGRQLIHAQGRWAEVPMEWTYSTCSMSSCAHCGGPKQREITKSAPEPRLNPGAPAENPEMALSTWFAERPEVMPMEWGSVGPHCKISKDSKCCTHLGVSQEECDTLTKLQSEDPESYMEFNGLKWNTVFSTEPMPEGRSVTVVFDKLTGPVGVGVAGAAVQPDGDLLEIPYRNPAITWSWWSFHQTKNARFYAGKHLCGDYEDQLQRPLIEEGSRISLESSISDGWIRLWKDDQIIWVWEVNEAGCGCPGKAKQCPMTAGEGLDPDTHGPFRLVVSMLCEGSVVRIVDEHDVDMVEDEQR